jgi:hypothetical protein
MHFVKRSAFGHLFLKAFFINIPTFILALLNKKLMVRLTKTEKTFRGVFIESLNKELADQQLKIFDELTIESIESGRKKVIKIPDIVIAHRDKNYDKKTIALAS